MVGRMASYDHARARSVAGDPRGGANPARQGTDWNHPGASGDGSQSVGRDSAPEGRGVDSQGSEETTPFPAEQDERASRQAGQEETASRQTRGVEETAQDEAVADPPRGGGGTHAAAARGFAIQGLPGLRGARAADRSAQHKISSAAVEDAARTDLDGSVAQHPCRMDISDRC